MQEPQSFVFGPFRLDRHDERLWRGQEVLPLRPKLFAVLCCLVSQAGQLVTKDALLEAVWPKTAVSESALTVAIRHLRRVLGDRARTPQFIETVHGRGYRFIMPLSTPVSSGGPMVMGASRLSQPPLFRRPPYFVGRDAALAQLAQWWSAARQGTRQVGVIAGEPGIGKTALVDMFLSQVAATEDVWIGHGQCLDHYGAGEAYLPILEALGRLCRGPEGERFLSMLRRYAPSWLVQMPGLVPPSEWEMFRRTTGGATQPRMLRELTEALDVLTTERPLVLVLEDLHWSDAATLAWLAYVARRPDPARLLLLGTYRPVDAIVRAHPIRTVMTELTQHQDGVELPLDYLSAGEVAAYCRQRLWEKSLSEELPHVLHQRTRGHPLFLVAIVDEMRRQGLLHEEPGGGDISKAVETIKGVVPDSLRRIIEQQLHHVGPQDQGLLEAASIAGRIFSAAELAAAANQATEDIEARLAMLAHHGQFIEACGLIEWPDGTVAAGYSFLHDLYREILYDRIPPSRQRRWHLQIGARKERGYGARSREVAAELAVHFEQGGDVARALRYLQHAANNALQRSAHTDAIAHLTRALTLLTALPASPERIQQELVLQATLGPALMAIKGFAAPEVAHAYARAHALCQQVGETPQLFSVRLGLCTFYQERAELQTARVLAEQLLQMAQRLQDPVGLLWAHNALGMTLRFMGEFVRARAHLEESLALYTPDIPLADGFVFDPGVDSRCALSETLYLLGYPDQALRSSQEALALARELAHPFSLAEALGRAARIHRLRGAQQAAQTLEEASLALYREQGFTQGAAQEMVWHGWDLVKQGESKAGIAQMSQGIEALRTTGAEVERPWLLSALAMAYGQAGRADEGLALLDEALAMVHQTGKRLDESGLYRCKGDLLLARDGTRHTSAAEAEACFHQALAIARRQQGKILELRAAMSLSRLWQGQGKHDAARELLSEIYGWFTEGFDTTILQEAKALVAELSS
jgi:DNA-binding winged helix-turn-helix (wHTH) protein/tetratricopeptide (TPR) repeat protein